MLEKSVDEKEGSYLFCDTDSLCIVGTKKGSFVACAGGKTRHHGKAGFKALSLQEIRAIADKFKRLNPYDPSLVSEILKIEDVNFVDSNPKKPFRQLYGYAISAKRYALYTRSENNIQIEKASGHGLGYLFAPKERQENEEERRGAAMGNGGLELSFTKRVKTASRRTALVGFTCNDADGCYDSKRI